MISKTEKCSENIFPVHLYVNPVPGYRQVQDQNNAQFALYSIYGMGYMKIKSTTILYSVKKQMTFFKGELKEERTRIYIHAIKILPYLHIKNVKKKHAAHLHLKIKRRHYKSSV